MNNREAFERTFQELLECLSIDVSDPNFEKTPHRVAKMYFDELLAGHTCNLQEEVANLLGTSFPSKYDGMVAIKGIKAHGLCPHHFLPVAYEVDVGYIPRKNTVGLSKLPRLVRLLASRPVLQEDFTRDIVESIEGHLGAKGAIAVVHGAHSCMNIRGVKDGAITTTSSVRGVFDKDFSAKQEFLDFGG